jgi:hypothetical protein
MSAIPTDWNIVIAGSWNTAILTPEGVKTRLFGLDVGTPIEVLVPIDGRTPLQMKYNNINVQPASDRLIISPIEPNPDALIAAVDVAQRALTSLPETPLTAAGVNIRYSYESMPDALIESGVSTIDDKITDEGHKTLQKKLARKIKWEEGVLNLEITESNDSSGLVVFNYHRDTEHHRELSEWVGMHERMLEVCRKLLDLIARGE